MPALDFTPTDWTDLPDPFPVMAEALKTTGGDRQAARAALSAIEGRRLERDIARIWGKAHTFLAARQDTASVTPPPHDQL